MTDRIELPFTCPPIITSPPSSEHEKIDFKGFSITGCVTLEPTLIGGEGPMGHENNFLPIERLKKITIKDYDLTTQEWVKGLLENWYLHCRQYLGVFERKGEEIRFINGCCLGYRCFVNRSPETFPRGVEGTPYSICSGDSSAMIEAIGDQRKFHLASQEGHPMFVGSRSTPYTPRRLQYTVKHPITFCGDPFDECPTSLVSINDSVQHYHWFEFSFAWIIIHTILTQYPWLFLRLPEHLHPYPHQR